MKKLSLIILVVLVMCLVTGCGDENKMITTTEEAATETTEPAGYAVLADSSEDATTTSGPTTTEEPEETVAEKSDIDLSGSVYEGKVDVDLMAFSSTMVYSEVYNMMVYPEDYEGKAIRMAGTLDIYYDEANDVYYYAVVIADALACCKQGIEFVFMDELVPENCPDVGTDIVVTGIFETYEENGLRYAHVVDSEMLY